MLPNDILMKGLRRQCRCHEKLLLVSKNYYWLLQFSS